MRTMCKKKIKLLIQLDPEDFEEAEDLEGAEHPNGEYIWDDKPFNSNQTWE